MNCKPGDLAIRVSVPDSYCSVPIGAIVRCIRNIGNGLVVSGKNGPIRNRANRWEVEWRGDKFSYAVADDDLRPIRDNDGEDETLTWAGKPESINA